MVSAGEFRKVISGSLYVLPLLAGTLIVFFPVKVVATAVFLGFVFSIGLVMTAKNAFDELRRNLLHRCLFFGSIFLCALIGFLGACFRSVPLNEGVFIFIALLGTATLGLTAWNGFAAGCRLHDRFQDRRSESMDWERGVYDLKTDSLDAVDISDAILNSFPTWKVLVLFAFISIPGSVIGVMAGKIFEYGRYLVAIPAYWAVSMVVGFFLLRTLVDFWSVRKMERARGVRLIVSTSSRIAAT